MLLNANEDKGKLDFEVILDWMGGNNFRAMSPGVHYVASILFLCISTRCEAEGPSFGAAQYEFMLLKSTPVGQTIGTIKASDSHGPVSYYFAEFHRDTHSETYQFLRVSPLGQLVVNEKIPEDVKSTLRVFVGAENSRSPPQNTRALLILYLTHLSAPLNLVLAEEKSEWVKFCWDPPRIGEPEGYTVEVYPSTPSAVTLLPGGSIIHDNTTHTCERIGDLASDTAYNISVYAYSENNLGIPSAPLIFRTKTTRCKYEKMMTVKGEFVWPSTGPRETATLPCPHPRSSAPLSSALRLCTTDFRGSARWESPQLDHCRIVEIRSVAQAVEAMEMVKEALDGESSIRNATEILEEAAESLQALTHFASNNSQLTESAVEVISKVGEKSEEDLATIGHKFSKILETLGEQAVFPVNISTKNLKLETRSVQPTETTEQEFFSNSVRLSLPTEVAVGGDGRSTKGNKVVFVSYSHSRFFQDSRFCWRKGPEEAERDVVSATVVGKEVSGLSTISRVRYSRRLGGESIRRKCAFWNETKKEWSEEGIDTVFVNDSILCHSTHLTSFSILLDPDPEELLSCEHQVTLTLLSYTGSALSILCLLLTISTHLVYRRHLLKERNRQVLLNLCFALLLLHSLYLLGSRRVDNQILCGIAAGLLHYALIAALMWMTIEGHHMYQLLVVVFNSQDSSFLLKRFIIGWGLPLLPPSIALAWDHTVYQGTKNTCSVSSDDRFVYYSLYFGPACIIVCVNALFYVILVQVVLAPRKTDKILAIHKSQLIGAFALSTFLGTSWIFGALAIKQAKIFFFYVFCISNSLQGVAIFVFRCVRSPEIQERWRTSVSQSKRGNSVTCRTPLSTSDLFGRKFSTQIPQ